MVEACFLTKLRPVCQQCMNHKKRKQTCSGASRWCNQHNVSR
ncbi:hypothetical protein LEMLEM_LOCUS12349 [Lemmus lemmus]